MALDFDTSNPVSRPSERLALVQAILEAHPCDEAEWIEWKTEVALDSAAGRFTASRYILGFANRSPLDAQRFVNGQAFLVVGAEPGRLVGTARRDPATLEDWLAPFLGQDGPVWDAHHVEVSGSEILIIEVAPPRDGDRIHTLRRDFEQWHDGAVFVRHKGKTQRATSTDMNMLAERAAASAGSDRVQLELRWMNEPLVRGLDFRQQFVEAVIERERERLLSPLEEQAESDASGAGKRPLGLMQLAGCLPENRDPGEYRTEVAAYLDKLGEESPGIALSRAIALRNSELQFELRNPTDVNFLDVEIEVRIEGDVYVFDFDDDTYRDKTPPAPPKLWGTPRPASSILGTLGSGVAMPQLAYNLPSFTPSRIPRMQIEYDNSASITFDALDLRPRANVRLPRFLIFTRAELTGTELQARWEGTSTSADGVASGSLPIRVASDPLTLADLLEPDDSSED